MADVVSADDVGRLLTLVAPGYFAYAGFALRFPRRPREELPALLTSVALSLPLVALVGELADKLGVATAPTDLGYVALLLTTSGLLGYFAGVLRGTRLLRVVLLRLGYNRDPELDLVARTVMRLPADTDLITVYLRDGRRVAGTPRHYNDDPTATRRELYLDHTRWWDRENRRWVARRTTGHGGVLVFLDEVTSIELAASPA